MIYFGNPFFVYEIFFAYEMPGIPHFYLMQKKRIESKAKARTIKGFLPFRRNCGFS